MNRIRELAKEYLEKKITEKAFRSAVVAQLSIMERQDLEQLAKLCISA